MDSNYENKKKDLFAALDQAEKSLNPTIEKIKIPSVVCTEFATPRDVRAKEFSQYKRKESFFKRAPLPINKISKGQTSSKLSGTINF